MLVSLTMLVIAAARPSYSIDGVTLGSNVAAIIKQRGTPDAANKSTYTWRSQAGGSLTIVTDSRGTITLIDVIAGPHEHRDFALPNGGGVTGESGHVNYSPPPGATLKDECGAGLVGSPCEAFTLIGGVELVVNFGADNNTADWGLSC